ncbi:MAG: NAD(P)/FAD-dependent oxidoreductase [Pirellulaceae bacterium]|nr:NAD(P)/FAD-dependent oxidoreductase [Pirellulaceae bacterium]
MTNSYDAIVIGSGMGGLTTASLMASVGGKRVLVLERHFKLGGFTHAFQRHGFHWDVGLHYVGGMQAGNMSRRFMDLVTGGGVQWSRIADPLEHFIYPDHHVQVPADESAYRQTLIKAFPEHKLEIERYFRAVHQAAGWMGRWFAAKQMPGLLGKLILWPGKRQALRSTGAVLQALISHPQLRAVLASQWGDYGLPPELSAFGVHALIAKDYFKGGYVPVGGAEQIAQAIVPIIERSGGRCLTGHEVVRLDVQRGRVTQVIARHKREEVTFTAPLVISDAGAAKTFGQLVPEHVSLPERAQCTDPVAPPTAVTIYIGFKDDPRRCGMDAGNYWIARHYDHDKIYAMRDRLLAGEVEHCFLSSASLRNGQTTKHNAQIICFNTYELWQRWSSQPWLNRDAEYQALKQRIAQAAIGLVDQHLPGFRDLIEYHEVSTPLSVESMTGHPLGAIYGHPATPQRLSQGLFHAQSSIKNLLLTGADVGSVGIVGAMMGGVMTAAWTMGPAGFLKLLRRAK